MYLRGERAVPCRGHRQRHGEDRVITVRDIAFEHQRDLEPRLHRHVLQMARVFRDVAVVEDAVGRAQLSGAGEIVQIAVIVAQHLQLAGLFLKRHLLDQPFDLGVHRRFVGGRGGRQGKRGEQGEGQHLEAVTSLDRRLPAFSIER